VVPMCFGCFYHMFFDELCCFVWFMRLPCCLFFFFYNLREMKHKAFRMKISSLFYKNYTEHINWPTICGKMETFSVKTGDIRAERNISPAKSGSAESMRDSNR
jgi:hypothetical protein